MAAWCWDAECGSWGRSLVGPLSLLVMCDDLRNSSLQDKGWSRCLLFAFFSPKIKKCSTDFFQLAKTGTSISLLWMWNGIKWTYKKLGGGKGYPYLLLKAIVKTKWYNTSEIDLNCAPWRLVNTGAKSLRPELSRPGSQRVPDLLMVLQPRNLPVPLFSRLQNWGGALWPFSS